MKYKLIATAAMVVAAMTLMAAMLMTVAPASADHSIKVTKNGVCHETNGNPRLKNTNSNWNASAEGHDRARAANDSLLDGDDFACVDGVLSER